MIIFYSKTLPRELPCTYAYLAHKSSNFWSVVGDWHVKWITLCHPFPLPQFWHEEVNFKVLWATLESHFGVVEGWKFSSKGVTKMWEFLLQLFKPRALPKFSYHGWESKKWPLKHKMEEEDAIIGQKTPDPWGKPKAHTKSDGEFSKVETYILQSSGLTYLLTVGYLWRKKVENISILFYVHTLKISIKSSKNAAISSIFSTKKTMCTKVIHCKLKCNLDFRITNQHLVLLIIKLSSFLNEMHSHFARGIHIISSAEENWKSHGGKTVSNPGTNWHHLHSHFCNVTRFLRGRENIKKKFCFPSFTSPFSINYIGIPFMLVGSLLNFK